MLRHLVGLPVTVACVWVVLARDKPAGEQAKLCAGAAAGYLLTAAICVIAEKLSSRRGTSADK